MKSLQYTYSEKFSSGTNFADLEHIQIVRKLDLQSFSIEMTRLINSVSYDTPDVPVNMAGTYHHLDDERSMQCELKSSK